MAADLIAASDFDIVMMMVIGTKLMLGIGDVLRYLRTPIL